MRSLLVRCALAVVVGALFLTADVGYGIVHRAPADRASHAALHFKDTEPFYITLDLTDPFDTTRTPVCSLYYIEKTHSQVKIQPWVYDGGHTTKRGDKRWTIAFTAVKPADMTLTRAIHGEPYIRPGLGSGNVTVTVPTKTASNTPSFNTATSAVVESP